MSERKVLFCAVESRSTQQHDQVVNRPKLPLPTQMDARLYSLHPRLNAFLQDIFALSKPNIRETTVPLPSD